MTNKSLPNSQINKTNTRVIYIYIADLPYFLFVQKAQTFFNAMQCRDNILK